MDLYQKAIVQFHSLFRQVMKSGLDEPTATVLATAGRGGQPSIRTILLKHADDRGFVFYTNKKSRKGRELAKNPKAALCFYWPNLKRQVIVEGKVENVSTKEADDYWSTRPRNSQIGGWASLQSQDLDHRETLLKRFGEYEAKFKDKPVPRPPHWGGYRLIPNRIEFWYAQPFRLHDRRVYENIKGTWKERKLYP